MTTKYLTPYQLHYNIAAPDDYDTLPITNLSEILTLIRQYAANPWAIQRMSDGILIAMSYDRFTSKEHAERNRRD